MNTIPFLDPLTLADRDPEYAKELLKVLEEEAKKKMVVKEQPKEQPKQDENFKTNKM